MIVREAACRCGKVAISCRGTPVRLSICHCLQCKKRTGSAFSWNATFARGAVETSGETAAFERGSDDGNWVRYAFCPACGTTMWYELEIRPAMISVPAGVFADAGFPAPGIEVYEERRCPWLPDFGIPRE